MNEYLDYRNKLFSVLDSLRQPNGVFRASQSEEYNATWIRDNYWCNLSYLDLYPQKYLQTCRTHLDFLHKWEREYDNKISWLIKDTELYKQPSRFIQPKVNFDGSEIKGLQWNFLQADTLAYLVLMMYYGYKNNMNVFRNQDDIKVFQILIDATLVLKLYDKEMGASWEEELACFTSNIGLILRALECAYEMGFDVDYTEITKYRLKFYSQFPYERTGRDWDLTLLFLCATDGILKPIDVEQVLKGIHTNLEREYGVIRYNNDIYKPFRNSTCNNEMQWQMGFGYLALIYGKCNNKKVCKDYIDKLMNKYTDGNIPEGCNELGESCYNVPLAWSVSMCIQAINTLLK